MYQALAVASSCKLLKGCPSSAAVAGKRPFLQRLTVYLEPSVGTDQKGGIAQF